MVRIIRPGLLALLAALLAWQVLSGQLLLYVHERTTWLVALSAPLLVAMALASFTRTGTSGGGRLAVVAVAVPVAVGLLVPARPLGSAALVGQAGVSAPSTLNGIALPESLDVRANLLPRSLVELGLARNSDPRLPGLDGQRAALTGFVVHPAELPADQFLVARFVMRCCTADAFAVSVPVRYARAADLANDTWVEVDGTVRSPRALGGTPAVVEAEAVRVVPQPSHPYLSP